MKAFKSFLGLTLVFALLVPGLTACSAKDKLDLLNALEKTALVNTYEGQSQISFDKVALSTNIDEFVIMEPFISMLDGMIVTTDIKSFQNQEKTITKAQVDMKVDSEEFSQETTVWSLVDLTGAKPVIRQITKVPSMFSSFLPSELSDKPYMVMDQGDLTEVDQISPEEYKEMMDSIYNMQSQIIDEVKSYALENDVGVIAVKRLDDRMINGKKHSAYQLELDDASLKVIMKSLLLEASDNEQVKELIKEFFVATIGMTAGYEGGQDLEQALQKLTDGSTGFDKDVSRFISLLDNVSMLGSQGIVTNFLINEDGYIVNQNGVIDLHMDSQQVEDALEKLAEETTVPGNEHLKAVFGMKLTFNSDISNINGDVNIDFPELTEENSFDLNDMLGLSAMNIQSKIKTMKIPERVSLNEAFQKAEVFPIKIGGRVMVPVEPVCRFTGAKYKASQTDGFSITVGKNKIQGKQNSAEITVNKKSESLEWPVVYIENHYFVPEQLAEAYLGVNVTVTRENELLVFKKQ